MALEEIDIDEAIIPDQEQLPVGIADPAPRGIILLAREGDERVDPTADTDVAVENLVALAGDVVRAHDVSRPARDQRQQQGEGLADVLGMAEHDVIGAAGEETQQRQRAVVARNQPHQANEPATIASNAAAIENVGVTLRQAAKPIRQGIVVRSRIAPFVDRLLPIERQSVRDEQEDLHRPILKLARRWRGRGVAAAPGRFARRLREQRKHERRYPAV